MLAMLAVAAGASAQEVSRKFRFVQNAQKVTLFGGYGSHGAQLGGVSFGVNQKRSGYLLIEGMGYTWKDKKEEDEGFQLAGGYLWGTSSGGRSALRAGFCPFLGYEKKKSLLLLKTEEVFVLGVDTRAELEILLWNDSGVVLAAIQKSEWLERYNQIRFKYFATVGLRIRI